MSVQYQQIEATTGQVGSEILWCLGSSGAGMMPHHTYMAPLAQRQASRSARVCEVSSKHAHADWCNNLNERLPHSLHLDGLSPFPADEAGKWAQH